MTSAAQQLRDFANKGEPAVLPVSGVTVFFKRLNLRDLVSKGVLPSTLLAKSMEGFPEISEDKEVDPNRLMEIIQELTEFTKIVLKAGLVNPRMVDENPGEDEITFEDLVEEDRATLMAIAQMPVKEWEPFLREERARLSVVGNGEDPTAETE